MALLRCLFAFRLRRRGQNAVPGIGVRHFSCKCPCAFGIFPAHFPTKWLLWHFANVVRGKRFRIFRANCDAKGLLCSVPVCAPLCSHMSAVICVHLGMCCVNALTPTVCALICVLLCALICVIPCALICMLWFVCSHMCAGMCSPLCALLCALICVLSYACSICLQSYVCYHHIVYFTQFHPTHCLGYLARIMLTHCFGKLRENCACPSGRSDAGTHWFPKSVCVLLWTHLHRRLQNELKLWKRNSKKNSKTDYWFGSRR